MENSLTWFWRTESELNGGEYPGDGVDPLRHLGQGFERREEQLV